MQAASDGDSALVCLLLDHGADVEKVNESNERALGYACAWRQPHTARLLLERGADPNALEDNNATYLDWATASEHTDMMELLRTFGASEWAAVDSR